MEIQPATLYGRTFLHMLKTNLQQNILIGALPVKIWKVLTTADYIDQYLFEGTLHCRWIEESPLTLIIANEQKIETVHKGKIVQVIPGVLLKYVLLDEEAKSVIVTYHLSPVETGIELNYSCEGFTDNEEDHLFRMKQTKILLQKIKWLSEYA
jgi:hypothetical protein